MFGNLNITGAAPTITLLHHQHNRLNHRWTRIAFLWNINLFNFTNCFCVLSISIPVHQSPHSPREGIICKPNVFVNIWYNRDDVIKRKHFPRYRWESTGHRSIPTQRPVMWGFDSFFYLRLNKRLIKQSRRRWFETQSRSLWRHCNVSNFLHISSVLTLETKHNRNI